MGIQFARRLREKAAYILEHGVLPENHQGKGAKHHSLFDREDVTDAIKAYIKELGVGKVTLRMLMMLILTYMEQIKPRKLRNALNLKIFNSWLKCLGYTKHHHRKGIYIDGHEREDVIKYQTIFTVKYQDETMDPLPMKLLPGTKHHHFIFQDESVFHANDMEESVYLAPGEQQLLHVSDFILESTGWLVLSAQKISDLKHLGKWTSHLEAFQGDAHKIIYPGKNYDAWWDMKQLLQQVEVAIDIFSILHPDNVGVFVFDCSSAHEVFAPDALSVQRMNVKPGGNQPSMRNTIIPYDCPLVSKRGTPQSMVFTHEETSDPKLIGVLKGMVKICEERGLTQILTAANKGRVVSSCKNCNMSAAKRANMEQERRNQMEEDGELTYIDDATFSIQPARNDCCMSCILALQSDFAEEKSLLQTTIKRAGHKCIFLPKFHCELNPIELMWGYAKREFSEVADGTFTTARLEVPLSLDRCTTVIIHRLFRKCYRYMDAYRKGLSGKEAERAVKKYKPHWKVGQSIFMDINMTTS
ncbi:hypothetical protein K439DRAFT_1655209 [Ramaria rubella]|nr:hypothetical protein K439DRAFT_1655209 [Ramaria rubella]